MIEKHLNSFQCHFQIPTTFSMPGAIPEFHTFTKKQVIENFPMIYLQLHSILLTFLFIKVAYFIFPHSYILIALKLNLSFSFFPVRLRSPLVLLTSAQSDGYQSALSLHGMTIIFDTGLQPGNMIWVSFLELMDYYRNSYNFKIKHFTLSFQIMVWWSLFSR